MYNISYDNHNKSSEELLQEIWECFNGHPVCGKCFDKDMFEERNLIDAEKFSSIYSLLSIDKDLACESFKMSLESKQSEKLSCLEAGSYIRPTFDKLDFFENTLNIRKDAIQAYSDYNADLNNGEEGEDITSLNFNKSSEDCDNETVFYNRFLEEECPPPYEASDDEALLKPVTLADMMKKEEAKAKDSTESNWKLAFEQKKREIDFFANTLDIRKNAIESYNDYSKLLEEEDSDDIENESDCSEVSEEDSSTVCEEESDEDRGLLECPECGSAIIKRNHQAEKISKLFFRMMEFRKKMV